MRDVWTVAGEVGNHIRDARRSRDTRQTELALLMTARGFRWNQTTVARVERGDRACSVEELAHIAYLLDVSLADLFPDALTA